MCVDNLICSGSTVLQPVFSVFNGNVYTNLSFFQSCFWFFTIGVSPS